ncbi:MAG: CPBP family intramembrane metalloprotease [Coriobacteriia bacterium]|nr:CPBP family intramembrane metalloprotease [Coriobacteriia bacterium]MCL2536727.1 CPBP family intramembrane metalloprotease [Coriobacteriia bacterium]
MQEDIIVTEEAESTALPQTPSRAAAIGWSLLYVLIFGVAQTLTGLIIVGVSSFREIMAAAESGALDPNEAGAISSYLQDVLFAHMSANMPWILLASSLITLAFAWWVVKKRGFNPKEFAQLKPISPSLVATALFMGVGFSLAFNAIINMPGFAFMEAADSGATAQAQALLFGSLLTALVGSTVVPLVEEIVFRGFILSELRRAIPVVPSVLLSSIVFGVLHGTAAWALMAGVLGIMLAWIALRTKSVYAAIAAHIGINAASFTFVWLEPEAAATYYLMLTLGLVLFVVTSYIIAKDSKQHILSP